jgi:hypothetical protein
LTPGKAHVWDAASMDERVYPSTWPMRLNFSSLPSENINPFFFPIPYPYPCETICWSDAFLVKRDFPARERRKTPRRAGMYRHDCWLKDAKEQFYPEMP